MIVDYVSINNPDPIYVERINQSGGRFFVVPRNIWHPICYFFKLRNVIRNGDYDIVYAHGNSATLAFEMIAAQLAGCKVRIAHCHSTACHFMVVHKLLLPVFKRFCTRRLACSTAAGKWLYGDSVFQTINNGIDTEKFTFSPASRSEIRDQFAIPDEEIVIGHVGAFVAVKNQTFLVEVMEKLCEVEKNFRLMLIGDGQLRKDVQEKVRRLSLEDRVIFAGETYRVADYLSACDLIAMPSLYEGLPLSLIEEQANGLSCVVSDRITREVDKTGNLYFLSLECGAKEWAELICRIPVPDNREEFSRCCIQSIKENGYDIHANAAYLKAFFEKAVGG